VTFSISGRCGRTGQFGLAISTSSVCVASRCSWARAGVGVVATQNITNPALGKLGLDLLEKGDDAAAVLEKLITEDGANIHYRQISVVGRTGPPATHSGTSSLGTYASATGEDSAGTGNLLANTDVPQAMVDTFEAHPDIALPERLLRALEEGLVAGGEVAAVKSAGLYIVDKYVWPTCDLRVDWSDAPIAKLREVWGVYEPQMGDYLLRAIDPDSAPRHHAPGKR
jgi:uncharacterized Ntn-hydrolase superfamily protein